MKKKIGLSALFIIGSYLLLLIPDQVNFQPTTPTNRPFAWNLDSLWRSKETIFQQLKLDPDFSDKTCSDLRKKLNELTVLTQNNAYSADDIIWEKTLTTFFDVGPFIAVHPVYMEWYVSTYRDLRAIIKKQSVHWSQDSETTRITLYKLLYGMRATIEEVLLQQPDLTFSPALFVTNEPSKTPSADLLGIKIHSGDILLSRGGAEVSALISRGNNNPGNFSHVALAYVDSIRGELFFIESHIEKGVAIADKNTYLKDKKLRFMVMRLRSDLPELKNNPMLPHHAAKLMMDETTSRHIPYDFEMNVLQSEKMFCSEVASWSYQQKGVTLWDMRSTISSPGVIRWLFDFGVENFVTQMPSDLEYEPKLSVVAEWRDPETLWKDHVDNAVMDILLESADNGEIIEYNRWLLPFIRVYKVYCMGLNYVGYETKIPEGMTATRALKNLNFVEKHQTLLENTHNSIDEFINVNKYRPPFWTIIELARKEKIKLIEY